MNRLDSQIAKKRVHLVSCGWPKPKRIAWLHYRNFPQAAEAAAHALNGAVLRGYKIAAVHEKPDIFHEGMIMSVTLTNLPSCTTESDIRHLLRGEGDILRILRRSQPPDKIVLGKLIHDKTPAEAETIVREAFEHFGPLQFRTLQNSLDAQTTQVSFRFYNRVDAHAAYEYLHMSTIPQLGNMRLRVNMMVLLKYTVLISTFGAIRDKIEDLVAGAWNTDHVRIRVFENPELPTAEISVFGKESLVSKWEIAIESLIRGTTALFIDERAWHPYFSTAEGSQFLESTSAALGGHIACNVDRQMLALFGEPEVEEALSRAISDKMAELTNVSQDLSLIPSQR